MRAGPILAGGAVLLGAVALASKAKADEAAAPPGSAPTPSGGSWWDKFRPPSAPTPAVLPVLPPIGTFIRADLIPAARAAARARGIPEDGFVKQMWVESRFRPAAYNPGSGALGVGQFIVAAGLQFGLITAPKATAEEYVRAWNVKGANRRDVDRWFLAQPGVVDRRTDPVKNIKAAARYMSDLYTRRYQNWSLAAAAYNRGPGNVNQWMAGKQSLPSETLDYAEHVAPWYGPLPGVTA